MKESQSTAYWHEKLKQLEVIVIIPSYNNGKTLADVIESVRSYAPDILVVNDGSTDETAGILNREANLQVITHPANRGKGVALKHGLCHAKAQGFRYAITIDSDGQHFASDIPSFIEAIEKEPDTLLVGSRNLASDNMPGKNTFANKFSNFWFTLETGIKLQDTQSGYRLYPLQQMNVDKWYYTAKYEFELEALVFAAWGDIAVKNIPVHVYYPPQEERVSHFRPFRDFTRISILNTVLVFITFLWIIPRNFFRKLEELQAFFLRTCHPFTRIQPANHGSHCARSIHGHRSGMGIPNADNPVSGTSAPAEQSHRYCSGQHQHPPDDSVFAVRKLRNRMQSAGRPRQPALK